MKVVTAAEMRAIEAEVERSGTPLTALMYTAGHELASMIRPLADAESVLVLVGPGNNGGDGLVAAAELEGEGNEIIVYSYRRSDFMDFTGRVVKSEEDRGWQELQRLATSAAVIVDALLGIGQSRPPDGELAELLSCVNASTDNGALRIAVDIPTGVNADTGEVPGAAFRADLTVAMGFLKYGHVVEPGVEYAGNVHVARAGIPLQLADDVRTSVPDDVDIAAILPRRTRSANKGSSGRLLVLGGSRDFQGAPALAGMAAYRTGAGLVEIGVPPSIQGSIAAHALEPIYARIAEVDGRISGDALPGIEVALSRARAVAFGSGMGLSDGTTRVTQGVLDALERNPDVPAVIDADGLNCLSRIDGWWHRRIRAIVTPHPGEMSRLTGLSIAEIQSSRTEVARRFAGQWGVVVVLKGTGTVIASPDGQASINPTGGPNLATAGTGDVLAGIIGGLLAQGKEPYEAAIAGAYLHGRAGDLLREEQGDVGTVAGDLIGVIPAARMSILGTHEEFR